MEIDYQHVLQDFYKEVKGASDDGVVAQYIPALASIDPNNSVWISAQQLEIIMG